MLLNRGLVLLNVFRYKINSTVITRCVSMKSRSKLLENDFKSAKKMSGWQIHSYSDGIQYSDKIKIPTIKDSNEILVKVSSTSVNPIDVAMVGESFFLAEF